MIATENEAAEKWCPFARGDVTARERVEDGKPGPNASRCIGAACMAWRWSGFVFSDGTFVAHNIQGPSPLERVGFCGLASVPKVNA
jgi:hypothetical protein